MGFFYYYSVGDNGVQDWGAQDSMLWGRVQDCLWAGARKLVSGAGRESLFPVRGVKIRKTSLNFAKMASFFIVKSWK